MCLLLLAEHKLSLSDDDSDDSMVRPQDRSTLPTPPLLYQAGGLYQISTKSKTKWLELIVLGWHHWILYPFFKVKTLAPCMLNTSSRQKLLNRLTISFSSHLLISSSQPRPKLLSHVFIFEAVMDEADLVSARKTPEFLFVHWPALCTIRGWILVS